MKQAAGQPEPKVEQKPKFQQKQNSGTKVLNKYKMTAERGEIEQAKKNFFRQENAQVMSIKQSLRRNGKKGTKRKNRQRFLRLQKYSASFYDIFLIL